MFTFSFAPKGWAFCNGALMNLQQNVALYSLIGVYYGGNGTTNFGLPDLRGRVPRHLSAQSPQVGQAAGSETVTLLATNLPAHNHTLSGSSLAANINNPDGTSYYATPSGSTSPIPPIYAPAAAQGATVVALNEATVSTAGGSEPHPNMQPWAVTNFCIAVQGIFPPRN